MRIKDFPYKTCEFCHSELGLETIKFERDQPEEFCSHACAESWGYYEDQHPFFEPEILEN